MKWTVHGERSLYDSEWIRLTLVDVEIPGSSRFEHHVVRSTQAASGTVVHDPTKGILLIWRHRFISDTWGWEIPAGRLDEDEAPEAAAARETLEETGWRPGPIAPLLSYYPTIGLSDQLFHLFHAEGATYVGPPSDPGEADRVEWVPVGEVQAMLRSGEIRDGLSAVALLYAFTFGSVA
ncbi:MAG: NUDIX hydrolase [Acidimicrobiia bacterium]